MKGLEAILMHNGFSMACLGGFIVFTGLILLALSINQIHKIIPLLEKIFCAQGVKQKK